MLKQLHEAMSENITLNLTIQKKGDELIVMVVPKAEVNDKATDNIPPIVASGNPDEVEQGIINAIVTPLKGITETVKGITEFEEKEKQIAEENKVKKAEKDIKKKEKEKQKKAESDKTPEELEIIKLLKEGNQAIEEKKDISAKSIKAKLSILIGEADNKEYKTFCSKLESLIVELSSKSLFPE